jgi:hypothetical protein
LPEDNLAMQVRPIGAHGFSPPGSPEWISADDDRRPFGDSTAILLAHKAGWHAFEEGMPAARVTERAVRSC